MALPPPQPTYVLRGHAAQIHAIQFSPSNSRLLTGDAEGYVICWSLSSKRPLASWRSHSSSVLGLAWCGEDVAVTYDILT
jgi:ASTRA-associated protein 1